MNFMPEQQPSTSKQDYRTPVNFLEAVKRRLGITDFAIDLAASKENAVTSVFYDEITNALACKWQWGGEFGAVNRQWGWLNPPFAQIGPWAHKAYTSKQNVAMLVPASTGSLWWEQYVHKKALVLFLRGRIRFVGALDDYPKDCVLVLYGPAIIPDYVMWNWKAQR